MVKIESKFNRGFVGTNSGTNLPNRAKLRQVQWVHQLGKLTQLALDYTLSAGTESVISPRFSQRSLKGSTCSRVNTNELFLFEFASFYRF